ncbi:MAG: peptidoglycan-associated lipoprotein Pal [Salinisphaera sp.]|nr:peptidoglycan-associated lipoprotein Pal [Salinisphaera sp.]
MNSFFSQRLRNHWQLLALALVVGLSACAGNPPPPPPEPGAGMPTTGPAGEGEGAMGTAPIDARGLLGIDEDDRGMFVDPNNPLSTRILYFPFDSSVIQPKYRDVIEAHAHYLTEHPDVNLRLEGHTDERGTREYNVALGERRAESVKRALVVSGASPSQITTLSFGEERPAVVGHTDYAYSQNRRVELIYVEH